MLYRGVVCGLGEMVQADRECLGLQVREKIDLSVVYLAQESTSIIAGAGQLGLEQGHHRRFGSVADHLDSIDEMFSLGKEPGENDRLPAIAKPAGDAACSCAA